MTIKILHVEDDPAIREAVKLVCEKEGYQVISFDSFEKALNELPNMNLDLALLDIMLESIDSGLVLYDKIQEVIPELPCIFLTSLGEEVQNFFVERAQWGYVLEKPVDPESLLKAIKSNLKDPAETAKGSA